MQALFVVQRAFGACRDRLSPDRPPEPVNASFARPSDFVITTAISGASVTSA